MLAYPKTDAIIPYQPIIMKVKIIVEAGLTGNPFNGHFNYCKSLSQALGRLFSKKYSFYFLRMNHNHVFKVDSPINLISYRWYTYLYRHLFKFQIWHITYQLTDLLPLQKDSKIVLTIHDLNFLKEKTAADIAKDLAILQYNIDISTKIVAISHYVKTDIERYCDLNGKSVKVIHNGCSIDPEIINQLDQDKYFTKGNYIFSIGVIARKKNFHILPYLLLGNNLHLVISGFIQDETYHSQILRIAEQLGVSDRVQLTGPVTELDKYRLYRDCSLFAFPSYAEGFGLPVVEAMRFGKKTLLSKHCSLPEIGGDFAYYLESDDAEYLKNFALEELPALLNRPTDEQAITAWSQQFNWDKAASEYEEVYQQTIQDS
ncbi:glycosyltransferase family 4 protein [Sphingobacterium sp. HJSM2_6]|uniref:glycosyltransferase family 4 protein n=1 Tax=Sphingobacterium sp. HJSM2_6 TaxID=3366264 RepID=UPI003BCBB326